MKKMVSVSLALLLLGGCSKENLPTPPAHFVAPSVKPVYVGSFRASKMSNSVALDLDHNVYVCEDTSVVKYDRYGSKLLQFGSSGIYYPADLDGDGYAETPNNGGFWGLCDIAVGPDGDIYTLEGRGVSWDGYITGNRRIQRFDAAGFHKTSYAICDVRIPNSPVTIYLSNASPEWAAQDMPGWRFFERFPHIEIDALGFMTIARMGETAWDAKNHVDVYDSDNRKLARNFGVSFGVGWCYDPYTGYIWHRATNTRIFQAWAVELTDLPTSGPPYTDSIYRIKRVAAMDVPTLSAPYSRYTVGGMAPLVEVTSVDPPAGTVVGFFLSILDPVTAVGFWDASGNYLYSFGKYGYDTGQLQSIRSIRVDPPRPEEGFPGYIYVLDPGRGLLHKFQMN